MNIAKSWQGWGWRGGGGGGGGRQGEAGGESTGGLPCARLSSTGKDSHIGKSKQTTQSCSTTRKVASHQRVLLHNVCSSAWLIDVVCNMDCRDLQQVLQNWQHGLQHHSTPSWTLIFLHNDTKSQGLSFYHHGCSAFTHESWIALLCMNTKGRFLPLLAACFQPFSQRANFCRNLARAANLDLHKGHTYGCRCCL